MSGLEDVVDESLGDQRVVTLRDQDEKNARQGGESVLTDCIQDFRNTVIQREDTLNVLWQQWSQVHAEMICLAVEILGKHNIHLEQNSLSDAIVEGISNAEIKNKEVESRCAQAEQSVAGLEKELNTLYEETSKTVKAQQKVSLVPCSALLPSLMTRICRPGERRERKCWTISRRLWQSSRSTNERARSLRYERTHLDTHSGTESRSLSTTSYDQQQCSSWGIVEYLN